MQMISPVIDKVEAKLKYWARQLHDLSGRNRLLFWKVTKSSSAMIEKPEFDELFEILVEKGGVILAPVPDPKEAKSIFENGVEKKDNSEEGAQDRKRKLKPNEIQTNHSI